MWPTGTGQRQTEFLRLLFRPVKVRLEADVLIPGRGDPFAGGAVVLDGAAIAYAGPQAGAPCREVSDRQ